MLWRTRTKRTPALNEPQLQFAKQARDQALRMPLGAARDQLLSKAEASELAIIEGWLAPLTSQKSRIALSPGEVAGGESEGTRKAKAIVEFQPKQRPQLVEG